MPVHTPESPGTALHSELLEGQRADGLVDLGQTDGRHGFSTCVLQWGSRCVCKLAMVFRARSASLLRADIGKTRSEIQGARACALPRPVLDPLAAA